MEHEVIVKLTEALAMYRAAGVGSNTDFSAQAKARDASTSALSAAARYLEQFPGYSFPWVQTISEGSEKSYSSKDWKAFPKLKTGEVYFSQLFAGDRFKAYGILWTHLGLNTARRHGSESSALGESGYGYLSDGVSSFEDYEPVEFVPVALGHSLDEVIEEVSRDNPSFAKKIADVESDLLSLVQVLREERDNASQPDSSSGPDAVEPVLIHHESAMVGVSGLYVQTSNTCSRRLLVTGEVVMSSDEVLDDNCDWWFPVEKWVVGRPWHNGLQPMRRKIG